MVENERIIRFPLPDWNEPFFFNDKLDAYCVCYQYNFDQNGFGPYGFNTELGKKIVNEALRGDLFYLNGLDMEKLEKNTLIKRKGVYVYSRGNSVGDLYHDYKTYKKDIIKNEIKKKKSLPLSLEPIKPAILKLMGDKRICSKDINEMLDMGYGVFIVHHYMPEAGDTFVFFDEDVYCSFERCANTLNVGHLIVDSINKLRPW